MILAQDSNGLDQLIGNVTPVGPVTNVNTGLGTMIVTGIRLFLLIAGLTALAFMLWGAYDYIVSGGDKEKITSAQAKIRTAVIGMVLTIVALSAFLVVSSDVVGIIKRGPNGAWIFTLPTIGN